MESVISKKRVLFELLNSPTALRRKAIEILQSVRSEDGDLAAVFERLSLNLPKTGYADSLVKLLARYKISALYYGDVDFPQQLYRLPHPPLVLFYKGLPPRDGVPTVAIVGSRKVDEAGIFYTKQIATELCSCGATVVSGLAYGVDAAAHWATLQQIHTHNPTIGVLAGGLNNIYPKANERLAQRILSSGGTLMSEYPPEVSIRKHHFLERNRIVAALSSAVVIIQAAAKSGALSTASHAARIGIDVFVLPGDYGSELYAGNHGLIQSGAHLLTSVDELKEQLDLSRKSKESSTEDKIISILKEKSEVSYEEIRSAVSSEGLIESLLVLEGSGKIRSLAGGNYELS